MLLLPVNPILMHSLSLLLLLLPLPAILMLSIGSQFIISGPTSLSVCHAILSGRDHSGVDHGYILFTLYMIHVVIKDGSARRSTCEWIFEAERQGRFRPPRREVGLALVGVRGYLTRLTRSGYLI